MLYLVIQLEVKETADITKVRELLAEAARLSRAEPGNLRFEAYQSQATPARFTLFEQWESAAALDLHRTAQAYSTIYKPQVLPLVNREAHPSDLLE